MHTDTRRVLFAYYVQQHDARMLADRVEWRTCRSLTTSQPDSMPRSNPDQEFLNNASQFHFGTFLFCPGWMACSLHSVAQPTPTYR